MEYYLALFVLLLAAVGGQCGLTADELEMMKKIEKNCQAESGLTDEDLAQAKQGNFGNNLDKLKVEAFCVSKKIDFMNADGDILVDNISKKMTDHFSQDIADRVLKECAQKKATPLDTAWDMATCTFLIVHP